MPFTIDETLSPESVRIDLKLCALDTFRIRGRAPTYDELRAYGFSLGQVEAHGDAAIAAAKRDLERDPGAAS